MKKVLAVAALSTLSCLSQASVVFSDNFNSNGALGLNNTPAGWTVTSGTVDVVGGAGGFGSLCASGGVICIDLDGSTNDAGILSRSFAGVAGTTYTATFDLAGNQRGGSDSLLVNFGTASQTFNLASSAAWNTHSLSFAATTTTNFSLSFSNAGGDNVGIVLDNVLVTAAVPEPETYALLLAGLGLVGTIVRRRKAKQA
jgi:hypothetical protein